MIHRFDRSATLLVSALAVTSLAACASSASSPSQGTSKSAGSTISIGVSIALTGAEATPVVSRGYQEAVSEVNAAGGLLVAGVRHPVKLIILDNRSQDSLLAQQVHTLVLSDNVVALLAGCCDLNVTEAPLANALRVPLVATAVPTELMASVNGQYGWDVFSSLAAGNNILSQVVPSFGKTDGKVALIANNTPEGEGAIASDTAAVNAAHFTIVAKALVPTGTTDFSAFINEAKSNGADNLIAQMPGPDCFALWKQMKALNYTPKSAVALQCGNLASWTSLGTLGNGALMNLNWTPTAGLPDNAQVAAVFNRIYPNDVGDQEQAVNGYNAAQVLMSAITRAGSTTAVSINTAIGQTDGAFPLGTVKFDAQHNWGGSSYWGQWQNLKIVQVYPAVKGVTVEFPPSGLVS
jgi:branched-chain amino acid transport system substrate-binding protein